MIPSPVKQWMQNFFAWRTSQKIETLASDIARQCRPQVLQRVTSKSKTLLPEQMRGYARAYATCYLEVTMRQHMNTEHLNSVQVSKVMHQAKEFLIEMVIRDMQLKPPTVVVDVAAAA